MLTEIQINNLKELINLIRNTENKKEFNKDFIGMFLACLEIKMNNIILTYNQTKILKEKLKFLEEIKTEENFIEEHKNFMNFVLRKLIEK